MTARPDSQQTSHAICGAPLFDPEHPMFDTRCLRTRGHQGKCSTKHADRMRDALEAIAEYPGDDPDAQHMADVAADALTGMGPSDA